MLKHTCQRRKRHLATAYALPDIYNDYWHFL